jgi:hypothetical protein
MGKCFFVVFIDLGRHEGLLHYVPEGSKSRSSGKNSSKLVGLFLGFEKRVLKAKSQKRCVKLFDFIYREKVLND